MGAAVVAVDTGIAEPPIAFVTCVAGPVAGIGERLAKIAEFAFLKS